MTPSMCEETPLLHGLDDPDPTSCYLSAIFHGAFNFMGNLEPQVDWSRFNAACSPVGQLLTTAATTVSWTEQEMLSVFHRAVEHGRADLLSSTYANPQDQTSQGLFPAGGSTQAPVLTTFGYALFDCVRRNIPAGVVLCLRAGADPDFRMGANLSPRILADKPEHAQCKQVILSFEAKTLALEILKDLDATPADGFSTHP